MTVLYTDAFTGADSNPIGGNWSTVTGAGGLQRLSNALAGGNAATENFGYVNTVTPPDDQYAQAVIGATIFSDDGGPAIRMTTGAKNAYLIDATSGTIVSVYKCVATVFTIIGATGTVPIINDVWYLSAIGNSIECKVNGVSKMITPDSSLSSGRFGLFAFGTTPSWDNFEGGDLQTAAGVPLMGQAML